MNGFEVIIYEKQNGIAYITLNRPKALNAYNVKMRDELYEVLGAIKDDPDVDVVILKGAGEKAFCAGADLTEFLTAPPPVFARQARFERDVWGRFLSVQTAGHRRAARLCAGLRHRDVSLLRYPPGLR